MRFCVVTYIGSMAGKKRLCRSWFCSKTSHSGISFVVMTMWHVMETTSNKISLRRRLNASIIYVTGYGSSPNVSSTKVSLPTGNLFHSIPQQLWDFIGFMYDDETSQRRAESDAVAMISPNQIQVYDWTEYSSIISIVTVSHHPAWFEKLGNIMLLYEWIKSYLVRRYFLIWSYHAYCSSLLIIIYITY